MNYRINRLLARKSYTSDTTEIIDINVSDIISYLTISFDAVNADSVSDNTPLDAITKVELVDGSDVLYSLDGVEAETLDWYNRKGHFMTNYNYMLSGGTLNRSFTIMFGRFLYDPLYALDPKKFNNLQLRITLDISEGGCSPATVYLTVNAGLFDQKVVSPVGLLIAKELKKYTMASTVHDYTDLPVDYPYRGIYFRAVLAGTEPVQCVSNIKISEDQDKRIPFDISAAELSRNLQGDYPLVEEIYFTACDTSQTPLFIAPTTGVVAHVTSWAAAVAELNVGSYYGDGGRLYLDAATAAGNVQVSVKGSIPHSIFQLPCGLQDDPADWFDVAAIRNLRADITGAAAAQGHIFIQQARPY